MINEIKNPHLVIGTKCVFWTGRLINRPWRCKIKSIQRTTLFEIGKETETDAITIELLNGHTFDGKKTIEVGRNQLWRNFTQVYKFIAQNFSFSALCDVKSYCWCDTASKNHIDKVIYEFNSNFNAISHFSRRKSYTEYKKQVLREIEKVQDEIKRIDNIQWPVSVLKAVTCYGFILEMRRRLPNVKCGDFSMNALELK